MPPAIDEHDTDFSEEYKSLGSPDIKTETLADNSALLSRRVQKSSNTMPVSNSTPYLDRIRVHPVLREIPWRDGQELSLSQVNASTRTQQKGALLLVTRGTIQARSCHRCANGNGRFTECVALDGFYSGSCATCVFPSKGNSCSLRFRNAEEVVSDAEVLDSTPNKRKRRSTIKALENASGGDSTRASKRLKSADTEAQLQAQLAEEGQDPIEYLNVVHKKHKNDHSAPSPVVPARTPILPPSHFSAPYHGGNINPHYNKPAASRTQHESWAIRPSSQHESRPSGRFTPVQSTSSHTTRPPPSLTSSAPPLASTPRYESMISDAPVIDTLPKPKQRQIYSVISGIQGGIDHLEKQLSSLKALLGIPNDDAMV